MTTTTVQETLQTILSKANAQDIADALKQVDLGSMFAGLEEDTGTITDIASIVLKKEAAFIESIEVVSSATAGSVGLYHPGRHDATPAVPAAAGKGGGVATVGADRKTITFPNTVTRVITRYKPLGTGLGTQAAPL